MQVAPRRLIAAAERLDPAGQALLSLWLHHGLSDERIAELAHATAPRVAERRQALLAALADELGLLAADTRAAFDGLAEPADSGGESGRPVVRRSALRRPPGSVEQLQAFLDAAVRHPVKPGGVPG